MEHVNNDLDDLFRKAGDLYPLKISESDWDGVIGKLQSESLGDKQAPLGMYSGPKNSRRKWLPLFLLVPLGLGSVIFYTHTRNLSNAKSQSEKALITSVPGQQADKDQYVRKSSDVDPSGRRKLAPINTDPSVALKSSFSQKIQEQALTSNQRIGKQSNRNQETAIAAILLKKSGGRGWIKNEKSTNNVNFRLSETNSGVAKSSIARAGYLRDESFLIPVGKPVSVFATGFEGHVSVGIQGIPLSNTRIALSENLQPKTSRNKAQTNSPSAKYFYIGILAGPDWSMVDFQSIQQPGFSLGALIGYRFNKRLALETGLLWDKKYYYSSGQYFNKSHLNIPSNENIVSVKGDCNMFEIPVDLKYDFGTSKSHGFFAKAGFSSYLMKKEYYNYVASGPYNPPWSGDSTYRKSSNYFFSVIQLSAGYQQAISKRTNIRIEPYVKIPLQGIGVGNLPISSAGVYFAVTHSFR